VNTISNIKTIWSIKKGCKHEKWIVPKDRCIHNSNYCPFLPYSGNAFPLPFSLSMQPYRNCTHIEATNFPDIHTNVPSTFTYFVLICVKKLSAAHTSLRLEASAAKFLLYCLCSTLVFIQRNNNNGTGWKIEPLGIFPVHTQCRHFMDVCAHTANNIERERWDEC